MLFARLRQMRTLNRVIVLYFVTMGLVGFTLDGGIYSTLNNLFIRRLGYGADMIGVFNATSQFVFACLSLPSGILGARYGYRRVMLTGLCFLGVGGLFGPLGEIFSGGLRTAWVMGGGVLIYIGLAAFFVNSAPYAMQFVASSARTRLFSIQSALYALAASLGSFTAGQLPPLFSWIFDIPLTEATPYRFALHVGGAFMFVAVAIFAFSPSDKKSPPAQKQDPDQIKPVSPNIPSLPKPEFYKVLGKIAGVRLFQVSGIAIATTFYNLYLDTGLLVPTAMIGMIMAGARLLGLPGALFTSNLTARFGTRNVAIASSALTGFCILPVALFPYWQVAAICLIGILGFSWMRYSSTVVFFLELVPPQQQGVVSGISEMSSGFCFTALAIGGGLLIENYGFQTLFLIGAALGMISGFVFWWNFRDVPNKN
jgi:MFS family permease